MNKRLKGSSVKKKPVKKKVKPKKRSHSEVINFKLKPGELKRIRAFAKRFAAGNLSAWLRSASLKYVPPKAA